MSGFQNIKFHLVTIIILSVIFSQTQYLIICPEIFNEPAQEMKNLHESLVEPEFQLNVEILHTETICNSCNNLEEVIEDTLIARINEDLKYVLFIGDENTIPPQYYGEDASDDFFSVTTNNSYVRPEITIGRIPVSSLEDANQVIDKIVSYTLEPDMGVWRSKILLFADDENKSGSSTFAEIKHTSNSNKLYDIISPTLPIIPLYGVDYEPIAGPNGLTHPELTSEIIQTINSGVSLLNYVGHGDPQKLAGEAILDMNRDINLINPIGNQLPIWVVGTCSFGHYDNEYSFTEALLTKEDGAIAVIATTRGIGATQNFNFLEEFFTQINDYTQDENNKSRLGDIFFDSKVNSESASSLYLFQLFGDPALRLPFPKQNSNFITSLPNTLEVLTESTVEVENADSSFILVRNDDFEITQEFEDDLILEYSLPGEIIFQGVFNNSVDFFVPLDAQVCDSCTANIMVYSSYQNTNHIDNELLIPFYIPDNISIEDSEGPEISLSQNENELGGSATIFSPFEIQIQIEDESGVNLMGIPGHQLTYSIDNNEPVTFDQFFNYSNSTSGEANITLTDINIGYHSFTIEAWDNVNNCSESIFNLYFDDDENSNEEYSEQFTVNHIYNVPNPFQEYTYFTFELSSPANVEIDIFTLSGIKVKSIVRNNMISGFNSIKWEDEINKIANGTYMYSFKAISDDGTFESLHPLSKIK